MRRVAGVLGVCGVSGCAEHSGFELRRKHILQGKVFMELIGKQ